MTSIGKREFLQHASKYLREVEEKGDELVITHQNKPCLKVVPLKKKSILNLRGTLKKCVIKGDINDPIFPEFDQW